MRELLRKLKVLFRKSPPQPVEIRVEYRDACSMRVQEWRRIPDMVKKAQQVLAAPETKMMLDALRNTHQGNFSLDSFPDLQTRAILQAQCEGYSNALADFQLLGVYVADKPETAETFEPMETDFLPDPKNKPRPQPATLVHKLP